MKTLLLGSTGMIGANILKQLLEAGQKPDLLVRNEDRARKVLTEMGLDLSGCTLHIGDVTDPASLQEAMQGVELLYHAAGLPEQWFADPRIFDRVNHQGTRNVLEAAKAASVRRVVYTSTIDVFQADPGQKYDESVLDPELRGTYYERSKQKADEAAVQALKQGMDIVFTHPSGLYGPGPITSPGSNNFIADLINGKVPMLLPGGFPIVFSEDCARGHILAAEKASAGSRYILSDSYFSLKDLAAEVKTLRPELKVPGIMPVWFARLFSAAGEAKARLTRRSPMLPAGQLYFLLWQAIPVADRAKSDLGWQVTRTRKGLEKTIAFLKKNGKIR
ncbi:MAG: NAD-dependent epimerase/dehydratase family protein [Leptospiraceae bacterium]|nr:NAD-dependent epimerase/dehydratase family protein [Leptospiraceae bacterium]